MTTRIKSPNYPSISLRDAIERVGKVFAIDRTYGIDRDVAVAHMGYSSLNGASAKVLASTIQYGLIEKTGKNQVRVTKRAVDILHPDSEGAKRVALRETAFRPSLFAELQSAFPGGTPSEGAMRSYLVRQGYSDAAIGSAIRSYVRTYEHVEQARAIESHGPSEEDHVESTDYRPDTGESEMEAGFHATEARAVRLPQTSQPSSQEIENIELNDIRWVISGGKVRVTALLDSAGIERLEGKLSALKQLLVD